MSVRDESCGPTRSTPPRSSQKAGSVPAGAGIRHPHLHGRPPGSCQIRRSERGDAHVIRNAGGRASDDAIESLVISYKLLGTKEWFVIHHSDCGMSSSPTT